MLRILGEKVNVSVCVYVCVCEVEIHREGEQERLSQSCDISLV